MTRTRGTSGQFGEPPRISGAAVPPLFPEAGPVSAVIFGEAPGPRGADQSGVPFWGDAAGIPLYRTLIRAGCAVVSDSVWEIWDGNRLREAGRFPRLQGVVLSNAYASCPSDDGQGFRAPKKREWASVENQQRLRAEIEQAALRGAKKIITLGRCAAEALKGIVEEKGWEVFPLPHPSSQGLLMDAPGRGRGMRLADLRAQWEERLLKILCAPENGGP
jgi:uracil-DNA glycosylase